MLSNSRGLAQINSRVRRRLEPLDRFGHQRHWIATGIGDATGEYRDEARCAAFDRIDDVLHLLQREHGGDVKRDAVSRQLAH